MPAVYHSAVIRTAPQPPAEDDLLCEACGYTLNGLPQTANCPECGAPAADSLAVSARRAPAWEDPSAGGAWKRLLATTWESIARPAAFHRGLQTRSDTRLSGAFAMAHRGVAAVLLGAALLAHADVALPRDSGMHRAAALSGLAFAAAGAFALTLLSEIAARLTAWEARFWGIRLPLPVVRRALHYQAPHLVVAAAPACAGIVAFRVLAPRMGLAPGGVEVYLYALSGYVILAAGYLFHRYWLAMKNTMYANR